MKTKIHLLAILACLLIMHTVSAKAADLTRFVNPRIGTGGHGHVFFGANVPWGYVQLGPTSIPRDWDWCSGYHDSDSTIIGFAHTHLSGTGIGDLSDILIMPAYGRITYARGTEGDLESGLWSYSDRSSEHCEPGYYTTRLRRNNVHVELTATLRVGWHHYTFPTNTQENGSLVVDLENGTGWDRATEGYIRHVDAHTIEGYRLSRGWASDQRVYFVATFSEPIRKFAIGKAGSSDEDTTLVTVRTQAAYARLWFDTRHKPDVFVKVALSPVSIEGARKNMQAEAPSWCFNAARKRANADWNRELSKIKIRNADKQTRNVFYTALYHSLVAPETFCDVDGQYYGADHKMHQLPQSQTNYTVFSLWDTYRAAHPLATLIHPDRVPDFVRTMLRIFKEQGKLPVWHLMGNETNTMIGNPAICVVADAILKGFKGFDYEEAYEAMKSSAMLDERGQRWRKQYGYIPYDKYTESVASDMEYAIADGALAAVALKLGHTDDYRYFTERSHSYRHYWDPSTGFMRGLSSEGEWHSPFDPFHSKHRDDDYTEGNAWQYTFLVPHDVDGLAAIVGKERLIERLDSLFLAQGDLGENASPDISGLIGQYAHGNEPGHHIIYLYTLLGQPWKTADRVREVLTTLYHAAPDGLSGNEDVGQMSSWYILSALGLYQVEPAGGKYVFGVPFIGDADLKVSGGTFKIRTKNASAENKYIQHIRLNSKGYYKNYITYEDIARGGTLEFIMGRDATDFCKEPQLKP